MRIPPGGSPGAAGPEGRPQFARGARVLGPGSRRPEEKAPEEAAPGAGPGPGGDRCACDSGPPSPPAPARSETRWEGAPRWARGRREPGAGPPVPSTARRAGAAAGLPGRGRPFWLRGRREPRPPSTSPNLAALGPPPTGAALRRGPGAAGGAGPAARGSRGHGAGTARGRRAGGIRAEERAGEGREGGRERAGAVTYTGPQPPPPPPRCG